MGCCASTPIRTTLTYEGQVKTVVNTTKLSTLRRQIAEQFAELKDVPFELLNKDNENFTQDMYMKALHENHEASVTIRILKPHQFGDPTWDALAGPVFRVISADYSCVANGFLVSDRVAITSSKSIKEGGLKGMIAHFDCPDKFQSPLDESFYVSLPSGIALVRLQTAPPNRIPIVLFSAAAAKEDDVATLIYYTQQKPALNALADQKITKVEGEMSEFSKRMPNGADGAPIFNANRGWIGVYLGTAKTEVLNAPAIQPALIALAPNLPPPTRSVLERILPENSIVYPPPSVPPLQSAPEVVTFHPKPDSPNPQEVAPAAEPEDIVAEIPEISQGKKRVEASSQPEPVQAEIILSDFAEDPAPKIMRELSHFGYGIDLKGHKITIFDKSGRTTATIKHENRFLEGISCVLTPEGLLITGPDPNGSNNAALCTNTEVRDITSMIWDHRYHTSVYFQGATVVISGLTNANVERIVNTFSPWERLGKLPESRAYASALVHENFIYVVGGIPGPNQDPQNSILQGDGNRWTTLELTLTRPLRGSGVFAVENSLVLFGGMGQGTSDNEDVWEINPATGEMNRTAEFRAVGCLHGFQPAYFAEDVLIPSESGAVYRYSLDKKKFSVVMGPTSGSA